MEFSRLFRSDRFLPSVLSLLGLGLCIQMLAHALRVNGAHGFPLDDPWIHLQFARNLIEYGSFSYFKNEMVTSGSTSPLYTFLLSIGLLFTGNEMLLSYALGIAFLVAAGFALYKLVLFVSGSQLLAGGGMILLFLEPRLLWAALSGMETTLFIFLLLLTAQFYLKESGTSLGITAGLLIWTRPEGLIFLAVLVADVLYRRVLVRTQDRKRQRKSYDVSWLKRPAVVVTGLVLAYVLFNLLLSGTIFPNTMAAKTKYYAGGGEDFPKQFLEFITSGHMVGIAVMGAVGVVRVTGAIASRKHTSALMCLLWPTALFLAYWKNLPFLYQEGRYLMPALPFLIVLAMYGVEDFVSRLSRWMKLGKRSTSAIGVCTLSVAVLAFVPATWAMRDSYAEYCKYISERQVRTAHWIRDNTPEQAVIATHDVGAIAYYGERRIVDMVGLVSPEMINRIGSFDGLRRFLVENKVTHLAVLRNWFEIDRLEPVFQTDETRPEIMEVFEFDNSRLHFVRQGNSRIRDQAYAQLVRGNASAIQTLEQIVQADPQSARGHFVLGLGYLRLGRKSEARESFEAALSLRPGFAAAHLALAQIDMTERNLTRARERVERILLESPDNGDANRMASSIFIQLGDSMAAEKYQEKYNRIRENNGVSR